MIFRLLVPCVVYCCGVCSYSFNTKDVSVITDESVNDTYFSYSLLLQQGNPSTIIVGAPKGNENHDGGSVYKCVLNGQNPCTKLAINLGTISSASNFFGSAIDGQDHAGGAFTACAPRHVTEKKYMHYAKGLCIFHDSATSKDLNPFQESSEIQCCDASRRNYYDYGFAMAGFDVAYIQGSNEVLLGAPGIKKFNGATVTYGLVDNSYSVLPNRRMPDPDEEDSYTGYKVTTARFEPTRKSIWYIAGAPRSNNLKGKVLVYQYDISSAEKIKKTITFQGEDVGSYYGSTLLAADVTNDGIDDVFIGAPLAQGRTWDEGYVCFYRMLDKNKPSSVVKLVGSSKSGGRFGAAMVSLGDFDLDSFSDVAISAPYEDDGIGAVYIYRGNPEGLERKYSQRLSPLELNIRASNLVRGFGLGVSRGADIDQNGHNDYTLSLGSSVSTISTDTSAFHVRYCISYSQRSRLKDIKEVRFGLSFSLDYRADGTTFVTEDQVVSLSEEFCRNRSVTLKNAIKDISPFQVSLKAKVKTEDIVAHGKQGVDLQIPFSHGCGDDNVCNTGLWLNVTSDKSEIILGADKELRVNVVVNNDGEPAYQCELALELPKNVELRNFKDCNRNNRTYTCLVDERLIESRESQLFFDVSALNPTTREIAINIKYSSLGTNKAGYKDSDVIVIPVKLHNHPYIVGNTNPDNIKFSTGDDSKRVKIVHTFTVGNLGPSPVDLEVNILLPHVKLDNANLFEVLKVEGSLNGVEMACTESPIELGEIDLVPDFEGVLNVPLNKTILLSCATVECVKYSCTGDYLTKSSEVAVYEIKMLAESDPLTAKYKNDLKVNEVIAFVPTAYLRNSTHTIVTNSRLVIFGENQKNTIALWVYVLSAVAGVVLLMLITYGLYKCHFFDRNYKDKLNQEKILDSHDFDGSNSIDFQRVDLKS
ncbi:integrin alpha-PS3-like isoform X2 [Cylas formicarius]|uniref:integrin alpha-PS3-like isoform X2 n=1 Tax=Cylas formicarius TaxID=197179 RepID=UPI002958BDC2|nr:integrin alpha-PS3-like isoform X2 [Cylas formicarius]